MTLGDSFWYLGDGKAAEAQYEPARAIVSKFLGLDHRDNVQCLSQLGISYGLQGRAEDSIKLYEKILPTCKVKLGADSRETLQCLNNLARACGCWINTKTRSASTGKSRDQES